MKKKVIYIVLIIAVILLILMIGNHFRPENSGIIGQADGPTAIFVSN